MDKNKMEKAFGTAEAAELLGVNLRTLYKWMREGIVNARQITGTSRWIIMESEIERLRNGNKS